MPASPVILAVTHAGDSGHEVRRHLGRRARGSEARRAAHRRRARAGNQVVAVLSARGKTTDELVDMAFEISERPYEREMDMLLSVGERISCALCAMAIHDMGHARGVADRLAGGDRHRLLAHQGADPRGARRPDPRGAHPGPDRPRRRLPGGFGPQPRRHDAGPRRLGHHGRCACGCPRRLGLRDLHRRRGGLHRRSAALSRRAEARHGLVRRDARDVGVGGGRAAAPLGRVRAEPRRPDPLPKLVRGRPRYARRSRGRHDGTAHGHSRHAHLERGSGDRLGRRATSPALRGASSARWPAPT